MTGNHDAPGRPMPDPAWKPHERHGQAGYAFERIPGIAIFLSEPLDGGSSVGVKILSADKGTCLSEATFPPADYPDGCDDVLAAAKLFSALYAARYFQEQAGRCLDLYHEWDAKGGKA